MNSSCPEYCVACYYFVPNSPACFFEKDIRATRYQLKLSTIQPQLDGRTRFTDYALVTSHVCVLQKFDHCLLGGRKKDGKKERIKERKKKRLRHEATGITSLVHTAGGPRHRLRGSQKPKIQCIGRLLSLYGEGREVLDSCPSSFWGSSVLGRRAPRLYARRSRPDPCT